ncbi:MAG: DUF488 domain-containing protein [Gaiellales bacterium]
MALQRIVTIGVYGFTAEAFSAALAGENIDLFCDLRARRGVRGSEYTFANARRLEALIAELGIPYEHFPELAPSRDTRSAQYAVDRAAGVAMRERSVLSPQFVAGYAEVLRTAEAQTALARIREASAPALFCVERHAAACHRSLVAAELAASGIPVTNVEP